MDPYLEDETLWPDFHRRLVSVLRELLPTDRYDVVIGQRKFPLREEDYLEIRQRKNGGLVTLVDVVSPANKTTITGRQAYLDTRKEARAAGANLVEIDLLLEGQPMLDYSRENLPDWDYAVTVTRATKPERHEVYTATLPKRLPRFRLPLAPDDRDSVLDLQAAFTRCYAEGGYYSWIDYGREPAVSLRADHCRMLDAMLVSQGLRMAAPTHEEVALAAYFIWQQQGCPHGRDKENWYQGLAQLRARKEGK